MVDKAEHLTNGANPRFVVTSLPVEHADLRNLERQETELPNAQCGTIRTKLLKIGAQVRISVYRVWLAFSESYPFADLLRTVLANLQGAPRWAGAP